MNTENLTTGSFDDNLTHVNKIYHDQLSGMELDQMPHAMIFFERDGSVSSMCAPEEVIGSESEFETIKLALDFAHYAFTRPDWMLEYMKVADDIKEGEIKTDESRPKRRLRKGGLQDDEHSKE